MKKHAHYKKFHSPERYAMLPPLEALERMGVKTGMTVADVGCATGFFTIPAAKIVSPEGFVYGVDLFTEMLEEAEERAREAGIANIKFILGSESSYPLKDRVVDLAILGAVLHELPNPEPVLAEIKRILKPGGRLAVLERKKEDTMEGPPRHHFLSPEEAITLLRNVGFTIIEEIPLEPAHYGIIVGVES